MQDKPLIRIFTSFEELREPWQQLEAAGDCYAFQSYDWIRNWHRLVGSKLPVQPCIALVEYPAGRPLMLLPLGIQKRAGVACLVWLGGAISDYKCPLLAGDFSDRPGGGLFARIWKEVQERLPRHDAIFLESQPRLIAAQENPFIALKCTPHPSNAHSARLGDDYQRFLRNKRSGKSINTEKRKQKRLEKMGTLRFVIAEGEEQAHSLLAAMIRQKSRSYDELGVPNLFEQAGYSDFFTDMTENHIDRSFVHLSALTLDGTILATHWGLVYKKRFYHLLPTYERSEHTKYAPGNILLRHLFEWCIDNGIEVYDFTVGDEPYKFLWRDQELELYDYFRARTLRGACYLLPYSLAVFAKRKIKQSPALFEYSLAMRTRLANIRRRLAIR
ncbi:MAG: GNAT family N-acetyltransferase [Gammaproteobacteria bacterium]|jgi:CelD/BcsL family acetyltransferase involved in cellulose biosynthesis